MPSMDIVSEINVQELDNAVNQCHREISQRFDFRGGKSDITFDKSAVKIDIIADDEFKLRSIHQILEQKMIKRSLDIRALDFGDEKLASGSVIKQEVQIKSGLSKEEAKKINLAIKGQKFKVSPQVQGDQIRVTSKSIDELQSVMAFLKGENLGLPLQFTNMKRD